MVQKHVIPTREELLDDIAQKLVEPRIPENSFTVRDVMAKDKDITESRARRLLDRLVIEGKLKSVVIRKVRYYYKDGENGT